MLNGKLRLITAVVFFSAAFFWAGPACLKAEIVSKVTYEYFPVEHVPGVSPKAMIAEQTPLLDEQGKSLGQAKWQITVPNVLFNQQTQVGICRVRELEVNLSCTIILPRLKDGGSDLERAEFERYAEKIRQHELGHLAIAENCARRLETEIMNLGDRPCDGFAELLQLTYDLQTAQCKGEQRAYDRNDPEFHP